MSIGTIEVTVVPPAVGPDVGEIDVTTGTGMKVNWSAGEVTLVPPGVVTVISTVPVPAGEVAVIDVGELTTTPVALTTPNLTVVAPVRLVPVIITVVPPAVGPEFGETPVTAGGPK